MCFDSDIHMSEEWNGQEQEIGISCFTLISSIKLLHSNTCDVWIDTVIPVYKTFYVDGVTNL